MSVLSGSRFPLVPLRQVLGEAIKYGTSKRAEPDPPGYPVLRMGNITSVGLDTSDLSFLDCRPDEAEPLLLRSGDILINRTNSDELVGKAAVFDLPGSWLFASYLLRLRVNPEAIDPDFLVAYLGSPSGRLQIERVTRRAIGMANINTTEIGNLLIPLPSVERQQRLLHPVARTVNTYKKQVTESGELISEVNDLLLKEVGAKHATAHEGPYAATTRDAMAADRLGAQFFNPERIAAIRNIQSADNSEASRLDQVADLIRDRVVPDPDQPVMGLSAVEPDTGLVSRVVDSAEAAFRFQAGDVLYSRLRPYLNKVAYMEEAGFGSTEFYVLRVKQGVNPEYLALALRSPLVTSQTTHLSTGNTHPRVAIGDAESLVLPIPDKATQDNLVVELNGRREKASAQRLAAERSWRQALHAFDRALLGSPQGEHRPSASAS